MKNLSLEALVDKHIGTLQHFIEDGYGWGLRVLPNKQAKTQHFLSKSEANELIKGTNGFLVKKGDCLVKGLKPSPKLLAYYWKKRFEEERKESNRLYNLITETMKKA